jgi:uncharacterized membrane protein
MSEQSLESQIKPAATFWTIGSALLIVGLNLDNWKVLAVGALCWWFSIKIFDTP